MIPSDLNHFRERPKAQQERLLDTLTVRRWGEAKDVAGYSTGTMIDISGGKLATQNPRLAYEASAAAGAYAFE